MDALDLVDLARPDVAPISHDERRRIREQLFRAGARPDPLLLEPPTVPTRVRTRAQRVVAGFVVLALVAGGAVALSRALDGDTGDDASAGDQIEEPVATDAPATTVAPTTTTPPAATLPVAFQPVLPSDPVGFGYELVWARYDGPVPEESVGLARYSSPGSDVEIAVLLRPGANLVSAGVDGVETWQVGDRTAVAAGDPGPCSGSVCTVDVQWDDTTAVSLSWVRWDGSDLDEAVNRDTLIPLIESMAPRPLAWEPGPLDQGDPSWDVPSSRHARLLVPGVGAEVVAAEYRPAPPGSAAAVFLAPDGSFVALTESDGPATVLDPALITAVGGQDVEVTTEDEGPIVYRLDTTCGTAELLDEQGATSARSVVTDLLRGITVDRGEIAVVTPPGWRTVDTGPGGGVFDTRYLSPSLGPDREISLRQSTDGTLAVLMGDGRRFERADVGGRAGWLHRGAGELALVFENNGTATEVRAPNLTVGELEALIGELVPATTSQWIERFDDLDESDVDTESCGQQPFFAFDDSP